MGKSHSVLPLQPEIVSWLQDDYGLHISLVPSRYPTLREIRDILDHLENYTVTYTVDFIARADPFSATATQLQRGWQADIFDPRAWKGRHYEGQWATLVVLQYQGNDDLPHPFYLSKSSGEVSLLILQRLSQVYGPLVVMADDGSDPIVVTPDLDLHQTLQGW